MYRYIGLITDYGESNWFVGSLKSAIYKNCKDITIIDFTHYISPGNVEEAAFVLWNAIRDAPNKTLLLVIVDPYVGTSRKILWCKINNLGILSPEGDFLKYVISYNNDIAKINKIELFEIGYEKFLKKHVGQTFHGRDVFPLLIRQIIKKRKLYLKKVTPKEYKNVFIPFSSLAKNEECLAKIIYIDRFGNCITNIYVDDIQKAYRTQVIALLDKNQEMIYGIFKTYSDEKNVPIILINGSNLLEIALWNKNASHTLGLTINATLKIILK